MHVFIHVCIYLCTYLSMYVFIFVCMYVDISEQYVCMHGHHIQQSIDQQGKGANPVRGQLCTHASVQLQLYTSGTNNHVPWAHTHTDRPRHKRMYTHAKLQRYTSTCVNSSTRVHYVRRSGCPYQILYGYKYSVRAQAGRPTHNRYIVQAVQAKHCTNTVRTYKHKHSCTLRTPPRLSIP